MNVQGRMVARRKLIQLPGDFAYLFYCSAPTGIVIECPCGCQKEETIYFRNGHFGSARNLTRAGALETPTLDGSFSIGECPSGWRGHLMAGRFVEGIEQA